MEKCNTCQSKYICEGHYQYNCATEDFIYYTENKQKIGYIYLTTNKINGKIYIGQHKNKEYNEKYLGSGVLIRKAINKYGKENFSNKLLEWCYSEKELNEKEQLWIKKLDCLANTNKGYNLSIGGNQVTPIHGYTEEQRKEYGRKISIANKGKKRSEEFCKRNSEIHKNKIVSKESRKKMSEAAKGRTFKERKYTCICKACNTEFIGGNWNTKYCPTCQEKRENPIDSLQFMLDKQTQFQKEFGYDFNNMSLQEKSNYIKEMSLWVQNEINEMIHEIPYAKPWSKKYDSWSEEKIQEQIQLTKEELIDSLLFMLNIFASLGMSQKEILKMYIEKNKINIERQQNGY